MKEKKRKGLSKLLSMAFTFVMVMVFAGFIGKVDVRADDLICKATVKVKDKSTGEIIENAQVIFTDYYRNGDTYPVIEVTQNEDGTYNLPYDDDDEWGGVGTIDIMQLHQDIKIPGLLMVQVYCEELQPDVSRLQQ